MRLASACRASAATTFQQLPSFTLANYCEASAFGMGRGQSYCLLTLRHPMFVGKDKVEIDQIYDEKVTARERYIDTLFKEADRKNSGRLGAAELKEVLGKSQLPVTDARVEYFLSNHGSDSSVTREQLGYVLEEVWGGKLALDFRSDLGTHLDPQYEGERVTCFIGRSSQIHMLLRTLRHTWPTLVEHIALMHSAEANPQLDPSKMEVFDEDFAPTVPDDVGTSFRFVSKALEESPDPSAGPGYVVRIRGPTVAEGADEVYVPLLVLAQNAGGDIAEPRNLFDSVLHAGRWFGIAVVGGTVVLYCLTAAGSKTKGEGDTLRT